ncbi:50S ribosomal protein L29 [Candidatus Mycoplasma haematobovis]|uniref:Large ribosomal subunit protein uL29 n=1 Tax=Candidatus Mycoplasma haematobovis TaxID=432608 RepID=A0A1A9QED9_9MOLU|nr:50S ribosomal protein L29 [Candidatus Mycoplasma haematobovis]OAL10371.1 50S ribosomal protein L29 [Candidatus Mycoplasma haematobovis]
MIKELRGYDSQEIKNMIIKLKAKLVENRFKLVQGELTNTNIFKETRRTIAQLLTILNERGEKLTPTDWKLYKEIAEDGK